MDCPPDTASLLHHFAALKDPRQRVKVLYPLPEILLLVLCATIVGADDFVEIQHWGEIHIDFLRRFLPYRDGIPSHDALNDLMNALNPALFSECFVTWVNGLRDSDPDIVSVDGKTSRRTHARSGQEARRRPRDHRHPRAPWLELNGAWSPSTPWVPDQIAATILEGADYTGVKDNQPDLHDDIKRYFDDAPASELETFQTTDGDHGRIEVRRHTVSHTVDWLTEDCRFPGIKTIAMVESLVERNGKTSCERRYYISSAFLTAMLFANAARCHWHIENRLHWGAGCHLPRGSLALAHRSWPTQHGHCPAYGHEPAALSQARQQPQGPPQGGRMEYRLPPRHPARNRLIFSSDSPGSTTPRWRPAISGPTRPAT